MKVCIKNDKNNKNGKNVFSVFKIITMLTILFSIIIFLNSVRALSENINSIDVYATIMKSGDIQVKQVWNTESRDGTEYYIPINNLNGIQIENFKVSDVEGYYQNVGKDWNIDWTFEQKARKCGINTKTKNGGIELCFGKTKRGNRTYNVEFTYKNAVTSFKECDAFNIMFVNRGMKPAPNNVTAKITMQDGTSLTKENAGIWGFGYDGNIVFENGYIRATANKYTSKSGLIIMVRLDKGFVSPLRQRDENFEDTLKKEAMSGSMYEKGRNNNAYYESIVDLLFILMYFIFFTIAIIYASISSKTIVKDKRVDKEKYPYWRDKIYDANLLMLHLTQDGGFEKLVSAQLLTWIREGVIETGKETVEVKKLFGTKVEEKEEEVIYPSKVPEYRSAFEKEFFGYILEAKGKKNYFTKDELSSLIKRKYSEYGELIKETRKEAIKKAFEEGYIEDNKKNFKLTEKGVEEAQRYFGYIRFLDDFTLMNEKEPVEVFLWDEILIIATILGRGQKVLKEFKEIAPDYTFYNTDSTLDTYNILDDFSSSASYAYSSASGGGGSSSFSGGGGFSGGGSGGGSR